MRREEEERVAAGGPQTQRGRGRPRKATYFGSKDDTNQEELPSMSYDRHYQISEVQTDPTALLSLVMNNQDDPFLKVRRKLLI